MAAPERVDLVTIGQYLQPTRKHHPVVRFVTAREQVIEFTSNVDAGYRVGERLRFRPQDVDAYLDQRREPVP